MTHTWHLQNLGTCPPGRDITLESIEHNVSIMRYFLCHAINPNLPKSEKTDISNSTVSKSNGTIRQLTVLIHYIDLFCEMHFSK